MSKINVTKFNQECKQAEFKVEKKVFFQVEKAGVVKITQLIIGKRVAIQRIQTISRIGEWVIPTEYKDHLALKEKELTEAMNESTEK